MMDKQSEVIVVRSLADSDLGIFAAHRPTTASKQRAININSQIASRVLNKEVFDNNGTRISCDIIFGDIRFTSVRHFGKVGKNWRLGGNKIDGDDFIKLDSKDLVLIRSIQNNDGTCPITLLFISKAEERTKHARIVRLIEPTIKESMAVYLEGSAGYEQLEKLFPAPIEEKKQLGAKSLKISVKQQVPIPPMPPDNLQSKKDRTIEEKVRSPHIFEQMLKVSSDLSAPAQRDFVDTITELAKQLRDVLIATNKIIKIDKDHFKVWNSVKEQTIGFVDGGLANLSMLGSSPIAARVGGYIVKPGVKGSNREKFITLKKLINEMFSGQGGGLYNGSFPDPGALRDAARISIEAAGAVQALKEEPSLKYLFLHGALVNPVSRYTDIMRDGRVKFAFPNFSKTALDDLLPNGTFAVEREKNFINVYLQQLKVLEESNVSICGVIERQATTTSVIRGLLRSLNDEVIAPFLHKPPAEWKRWFLEFVDPADEDEGLGQRITDSLLFRCVLEPGEVLMPVEIDRNELRRAPEAWKDSIRQYPKPHVSYIQANAWSAPFRIEIFNKDLNNFNTIAELILHCSLLLPQYAFPAGLDIVDKFAKIPNWISKPINTNTAVQALKEAFYKGDQKTFDSLRSMLCGSERDWLLRPSILK